MVYSMNVARKPHVEITPMDVTARDAMSSIRSWWQYQKLMQRVRYYRKWNIRFIW